MKHTLETRLARGARLVLATAFCLLLCAAGGAARADAPPLALVTNGATAVSGLFLSADGVLAAPAVPGAAADWTVAFGGERYPAKVVADLPRYALVLLKVDRQRPFPALTLEQRPFPATAKLRLAGLTALGSPVSADVRFDRVRRRVAEQSLDGSYYQVNVLGATPRDGAVLQDADTGAVYGMLVGPTVEGARLVLFGSSIMDRVASQDVVTGVSDTGGASLVLASGQSVSSPIRLLSFRAASTYNDATQVRAVQSWRKNTGFWVNALTSPEILGDHAFFGAQNGLLYSVNLNTMQREWAFPNENPVFFTPALGPSQICVSSGNLKFATWDEADTSLAGLLFNQSSQQHAIFDQGVIACVDATSGAFKWDYHTRFVSQPLIVGDKVVFAGMGILGVLNLADGKEQWTHDLARDNDKPTYVSVAGSDGQKIWTLGVPTKLTGDNTREKPFRLEQRGDAKVECYAMSAEDKPLWYTPIKASPGVPALSTAVMMPPDRSAVYGATAKDMFAVDPATGRLRWQVPVFDAQFAGSLAYGSSLLFANSTDDKLYAVSAVDGRVMWVFSGAKAPLCIPLVQDGIVYIGSLDTWIYALDARTGGLVWKFETAGKVCGQPRVVGNKLYAMCDDGRLTEITLPQ